MFRGVTIKRAASPSLCIAYILSLVSELDVLLLLINDGLFPQAKVTSILMPRLVWRPCREPRCPFCNSEDRIILQNV